MIDENRHEKAFDIFAQACDMSPNERSEYIREACRGDRALHNEVSSLLAHDASPADLDGAVLNVARDFLSTGDVSGDAVDPAALLPVQLGAYRIIRKLGEGGMGQVFEAEQESPRRRVALKVIRAGGFSPTVIRRFEQEAFVLGQLQHPGIAHIYESGMIDVHGHEQPFFAMELIEGEPLDKYVKKRGLDRRRILALFVRICEAVQHAHQKGVIHRDLKPGNILVKESDHAWDSQNSFEETDAASAFDGLGTPKILDFGIARVTHSDLQEATLKTEAGQIVGTLGYMSPEQVTGSREHIDTRSDIYALGVILFQLLTDRLPFDLNDQGIAYAARRICDEEPTRMSAIDRTLRGDIDTIVSKALEKDTARRYQTAAELATDIRRFLNDQPILARPASTMYQLRKFTRRNKALVGGIVMTIIALSAGLIASGTLLVSVTNERDAKQAALEASDAVTRFLTDMITRASPQKQGKDVTVRKLMGLAEQDINKHFAKKPLIEARIRATMGSTYVALGEYDLADDQLQQAISLFQLEPDSSPKDLFETRLRHATVSMYRDDFLQARVQLNQLLKDIQNTHGHGLNVGFLYTLRARTSMRTGRPAEAAEDLSIGIDLLIERYGAESAVVLGAKSNLAELYSRLGSEQTVSYYRELIEQSRDLRGGEHPETLLLMGNLANHYRREERCRDAIPMLRDVYDGQLRKLGESHRQTLITISNLSRCLADIGRTEEAIDAINAGLASSIEHNGEQSPTTLFLTLAFGQILRHSDDEAAESTLRHSVELHRQVSGPTAEGTWRSEAELLRHFIKQRRATEAVDWAEEIYEAMRDSLPENHARFTQIHYYLGQAYALADRAEDAARHLLEAERTADQTWLPKVRQQLDELRNQSGPLNPS